MQEQPSEVQLDVFKWLNYFKELVETKRLLGEANNLLSVTALNYALDIFEIPEESSSQQGDESLSVEEICRLYLNQASEQNVQSSSEQNCNDASSESGELPQAYSFARALLEHGWQR